MVMVLPLVTVVTSVVIPFLKKFSLFPSACLIYHLVECYTIGFSVIECCRMQITTYYFESVLSTKLHCVALHTVEA